MTPVVSRLLEEILFQSISYYPVILIIFIMKYISVLSVVFATVAVAAPTTDADARKKVDMTLCKEENFANCTVFKDVERQVCSKFYLLV